MVIHPKTLELAANLIEKFEGSEASSYLDPVGVPTICTGMTRYSNGEPVRMGDICKPAICHQYTIETLQRESEGLVSRVPKWGELGHKRQASLLSFAWNMGFDFDESSHFTDIRQILEAGSKNPQIYQELSRELLKYTTINGNSSQALENRRKIEGELWDKEGIGPLPMQCRKHTYLKKAVLDPIWLSDEARLVFDEDEVVNVWKVQEIPNDLHNWVWISGSDKKWAAYMPDWEFIRTTISDNQSVDWHDMSCCLGKYLTVGELLQYDPRKAPERGSREEESLITLAREFNIIREAWNGYIGVAGGFRPEPYNREMGEPSGSAYEQGKALDLYPVDYEHEHFFQWLKSRWKGGYKYNSDAGIISIDMLNNGCFSGIR